MRPLAADVANDVTRLEIGDRLRAVHAHVDCHTGDPVHDVQRELLALRRATGALAPRAIVAVSARARPIIRFMDVLPFLDRFPCFLAVRLATIDRHHLFYLSGLESSFRKEASEAMHEPMQSVRIIT